MVYRINLKMKTDPRSFSILITDDFDIEDGLLSVGIHEDDVNYKEYDSYHIPLDNVEWFTLKHLKNYGK